MGVGEAGAVIRSMLMLDGDYASLQVRTGHPEELIRGGDFGEHKMELSKFMSQKYTEADPYYLFQHDLLDRMPKIKRFFKRCGPAQGTIRQRSLSRTQELALRAPGQHSVWSSVRRGSASSLSARTALGQSVTIHSC